MKWSRKRKLCFTTTQLMYAQLLSAGSDPGLTRGPLWRKRKFGTNAELPDRSLSILLRFHAEKRALRPLRVTNRDFRVPRIRHAHRPQRNAHVEEVISGLNQRIGI